ncbi:MAG TPA: serine hydrolase [Mycobacteriales bacterium]|nr:serine hydrolase [Mycobacteriales bacterium]
MAVYDAVAGREWTWRPAARAYTASIVKVDILAALLHRTHGLSAAQRTLSTAMIEQSDNDAASALYGEIGGAAGLDRFDAAAGMSETSASTSWGLTRTSASDQVTLLRLLASSNDLLSTRDRRFELGLMRSVTKSQCWGIAPCLPKGVSVALKNGWVPLSSVHGGGWQVNSIAYVKGDGRRYFLAVLTHGPAFTYGIDTIENRVDVDLALHAGERRDSAREGVTTMTYRHPSSAGTASATSVESCEGRQRFDTYPEADRQAWYAMARRRHFDEDFMLAAHFCRRCDGWHVGNPRRQGAERWSASLA